MDEVYRLFDRRCCTATALKRLAKFGRVRRFKRLGKALDKLKSPTLDKALLFLDDELWVRRATGWSVVTAVFARPRRASIQCARPSRSVAVWPWTCTASSVLAVGLRP